MTKDEALKIPELCIEVTPLVEDAFYAFREIDDKELQERLDRLPDDYVSGDPQTDELMEKFDRDIESAENARLRFIRKSTVFHVPNGYSLEDSIRQALVSSDARLYSS